MTEERFELLAENYEAERADLKKKVLTPKKSLSEPEENERLLEKFIADENVSPTVAQFGSGLSQVVFVFVLCGDSSADVA